MAISQWEEDLRTGIEQFDNEHKKLFNIIDQLNIALKDKSANSKLQLLLSDLDNYTKTHFKNEEDFLRLINYPRIDEQINEHNRFINEILKYKNDFDNNKFGLSIQVIGFLRDWLFNHIKIKDGDYGKYVLLKGV